MLRSIAHNYYIVPPADVKHFKTSFLRDFWHLNVAMMNSNNALVPDPDKEDILASLPFDWPFLYLGLRMCGWGDTQTKFYLIGTPVIWWGGSISLIVSLGAFGVYLMMMQRKYVVMSDSALFIHLFFCARDVSDACTKRNGTTSCMSEKSHLLAGHYILVNTPPSYLAPLKLSPSSFHNHGACNIPAPLCTYLWC
jgi:hypothetical protein